jgi:hypothetical protein
MRWLVMGLHSTLFASMSSDGCGSLRAGLVSAKEEGNMTLGFGNAAADNHHLRVDSQ